LLCISLLVVVFKFVDCLYEKRGELFERCNILFFRSLQEESVWIEMQAILINFYFNSNVGLYRPD
jgi:hypothetical protein